MHGTLFPSHAKWFNEGKGLDGLRLGNKPAVLFVADVLLSVFNEYNLLYLILLSVVRFFLVSGSVFVVFTVPNLKKGRDSNGENQ